MIKKINENTRPSVEFADILSLMHHTALIKKFENHFNVGHKIHAFSWFLREFRGY